MAISWRDKIEFSHEIQDSTLEYGMTCYEPLDKREPPQEFDLESAAKAWKAQLGYTSTETPAVFIREILQQRFKIPYKTISPLYWNFWLDTLANLLERGSVSTYVFEDAVSERWKTQTTLDDEARLEEIVNAIIDVLLDSTGNLTFIAPYFTVVFRGAIELMPPGFFLERLVARKPNHTALGKLVSQMSLLLWEHRVANGEVIDALGDAFYDALVPTFLTGVLKNAPHPRAIRAHLERSYGSIGPRLLLAFFGEDHEELARLVDIDTKKNRDSSQAFAAAHVYVHHFGFTEEGLANFATAFASSKGARTAAMLHVHSPFVAPYMYKALDLKSLSALHLKAERWLKNEGANAIEGLVTLARSRGKKRDLALEYLRDYVERGHENLIRESMQRAPKKVVKLLEEELFTAKEEPEPEPETLPEMLANDLLSKDDILSMEEAPEWLRDICAFPKKYHAGPDFSVDAPWPVVRLANGGKALSPEMLERICATLCSRNAMVGTMTRTVADLERALEGKEEEATRKPTLATLSLRDGLDPKDAEDFWFFLHSISHAGWISHALADFAGPRAITHAAALLRRDREHVNPHTSIESTFFEQDRLLQGLMLSDREEAWRELARLPDTITQNNRWWTFDNDMPRIEKQLLAHPNYDRIDFSLGLVPLLGLDENASMTFDYGGEGKKQRTITFHVDATLQCVFKDNKGKTYSSVPSARKGEDRDAVELHKQTMKWTRSVLDRAFEGTRSRLETMLRTFEKLTLGKLRHDLITHPWQRHFLRALVWGHYKDGALVESFLCDLDGAITDASFETIDLPDDTIIGLVHPIELDPTRKLAWEQTLAESELIQPFPQLEREVLTANDWVSEKAWFGTLSNYKLSSNANQLLRRSGWETKQTKIRGGYSGGKIWFASFPVPDRDVFGAAMVIEKQWSDRSNTGEPGLYFFSEEDDRAPENRIDWLEIPERIISEVLLDFRAVFG